MGIEAIGSIGSAIGSVASAIGRGATSVGRISGEMPSAGAASVSGSSFIAPAFEAAPIGGFLSTIVNEGPVASLEGFKPMGISDIGALALTGGSYQPSFSLAGEILFKARSQMNEVDVVAEAETILAQVQKPAINSVFFSSLREVDTSTRSNLPQIKEIATLPLVARNDKLVEPMATPVAIPNIVEYPQPQAVALPESRISVEVAPAVLTQPAVQEQETVEEIVTEKVIKKETGLIGEEEITKEKRLYLVDENALIQRIYEIRQAVNKAGIEAKRLGLGESIDGSLIAKFMPVEHAGNRSSIVQPNGPDGSYEETKEAVRIGQFYSEDQVEDVVLENIPVKEGKDGKPVKDEAVWKVLKHWTIKPVQTYQEVIRRIIKKSSAQPGKSLDANTNSPLGWTEVVDEKAKTETSLEDYPKLADVFQKAA